MTSGAIARWLGACMLFGVVGILPSPVLAQSATPTANLWLPSPDATGDPTLAGVVDHPVSGSALPPGSTVQVDGWVVDRSAPPGTGSGIDAVQVWDGPMGFSGHRLADATVQVSRPDVAQALGDADWGASGFSASTPIAALRQNGAVLYVYAHTPSRGWWYTLQVLALPMQPAQANPEIDVSTPTQLATVHANAPFVMRGYAVDRSAGPDQGAGIDRVQVYLNGDRANGIAIGDATLGQPNANSAVFGAQFAQAGWQLTFQPASWMSSITDNQITPLVIYAHSSVTGRESHTTVQIVISVP